ncbi:hypothetical protein AMATHDRAFT_171189 [Amanita thiersii Skay4041]|uniref:Cytochrome b-c1 complex subunit 8 n=1 Tax=Amanita thiersii Skay4041 TaxID=703135 RepID=A0A2A9NSB3_9AGAR|nr:hypothetical protein AMATHDRAFT_171189 [Amanita thiersii Skay4041]
MRPTFARHSDMPGPKVYNLWWGDQTGIRQKGITQYTLSPFQAKAAPKMIRNYLFNGYRRLAGEAIFWIIPFGIGYGVYTWARNYEEWAKSKAGHLALEGHHD